MFVLSFYLCVFEWPVQDICPACEHWNRLLNTTSLCFLLICIKSINLVACEVATTENSVDTLSSQKIDHLKHCICGYGLNMEQLPQPGTTSSSWSDPNLKSFQWSCNGFCSGIFCKSPILISVRALWLIHASLTKWGNSEVMSDAWHGESFSIGQGRGPSINLIPPHLLPLGEAHSSLWNHHQGHALAPHPITLADKHTMTHWERGSMSVSWWGFVISHMRRSKVTAACWNWCYCDLEEEEWTRELLCSFESQSSLFALTSVYQRWAVRAGKAFVPALHAVRITEL